MAFNVGGLKGRHTVQKHVTNSIVKYLLLDDHLIWYVIAKSSQYFDKLNIEFVEKQTNKLKIILFAVLR